LRPRRTRPTSPPPHPGAAGVCRSGHAVPAAGPVRAVSAGAADDAFPAATCYARSSRRIFNWLLNHSGFGPLIREWREYRAIPYRAKRIALILIALSFAISITFFVPGWPAKLAMGGGGLILMAWIARIPSRDTPSGLG